MADCEIVALVADLRASTPLGQLSAAEALDVFTNLSGLGYHISTRLPVQDEALQSDEDLRQMLEYLQRETPLARLNLVDARTVFIRLAQSGYHIEEPAKHPSGLDTTAKAYQAVRPLHGVAQVGFGRTVLVGGKINKSLG